MCAFEAMGDLLKQQAKHWAVRYDERTGSWEILDLWHLSLASLSPDDEVPDDSPALKILPADAFTTLLSEADRLGILTRWVGPKVRPPEEVKKIESEQVGLEVALKQAGGEASFNYKIQLETIEAIRQVAEAVKVLVDRIAEVEHD